MKRLLAHRAGEIPSLVAQRPDVPKPLDAVFRRMVAKNPDDRYQSMTEVVEALEAVRAAPVLAKADAGDAASQASYWNLFSWSGAAGGQRSSTIRSRSYEATVELSSPEEDTAPGLLKILTGKLHRNPLVTAVGAAALVLLVAAGIWFATSLRDGSPSVAVAQNDNPDSVAGVDQKSETPAIAEPTTEVAAPPIKADEWLDVLPLIDLEKYPPRRGSWSRDGSGLQYAAQANTTGLLALPLTVSGSHRWRMEISCWGAGLGQLFIFPVDSSWVRLMLDGGRNQAHAAGLERVKGLFSTDEGNPTATTFRLESGKRYVLDLTVQISGQTSEVELQIDGQPLFKWNGPTKDLTLPNPAQAINTTAPELLGVRPFTIYSLKIQSFDGGSVKLLHRPPPAFALPSFAQAPTE